MIIYLFIFNFKIIDTFKIPTIKIIVYQSNLIN